MPAPAASHRDRYHPLRIALHWLTLLLVIAVFACIELRELYPRGSDPREALKAWHFTLGLSVLAITLVRLAARRASPAPPIVPSPPRWQHLAAGAVHLLLYAWLLAMPLLGWLLLSASGKAIPFWGLALPGLVAADPQLADRLKDLHETLANAGYLLVGIHAAAALAHHVLFRDDTLRRMLPGGGRGRGRTEDPG
ncbi:MAG: cytochrome b [Pseudoxanthomonas sp.]|nr:cytochrome b [Pseudoxanthomonas sp.]